MEIVVLFEKREAPWGGGNQFLKALESQLENFDYPSPKGPSSRFLLVNSHHFGAFFGHLRAGISDGDKVIHRIDGPISSTRRTIRGRLSDLQILLFSTLVSDGVVFQSGWSKQESKRLGLNPKQNAVIHNAPDPEIFNWLDSRDQKPNRRKRVIVTSWSTNSLKGFDSLEKIAASLPAEEFEFLFVGNSPRPLNKFAHLPPMASEPLATHLRSSDIYLSASINDSCSNSLLEAIHCGLVPVVINSGGNPEIVAVRELLFETADDAASILRQDLASLRHYAKRIKVSSLLEVTTQYVDFAARISKSQHRKCRRLMFELFVSLDYFLRIVGLITSALSALRFPRKAQGL